MNEKIIADAWRTRVQVTNSLPEYVSNLIELTKQVDDLSALPIQQKASVIEACRTLRKELDRITKSDD